LEKGRLDYLDISRLIEGGSLIVRELEGRLAEEAVEHWTWYISSPFWNRGYSRAGTIPV
jgi:hypothetical protein